MQPRNAKTCLASRKHTKTHKKQIRWKQPPCTKIRQLVGLRAQRLDERILATCQPWSREAQQTGRFKQMSLTANMWPNMTQQYLSVPATNILQACFILPHHCPVSPSAKIIFSWHGRHVRVQFGCTPSKTHVIILVNPCQYVTSYNYARPLGLALSQHNRTRKTGLGFYHSKPNWDKWAASFGSCRGQFLTTCKICKVGFSLLSQGWMGCVFCAPELGQCWEGSALMMSTMHVAKHGS